MWNNGGVSDGAPVRLYEVVSLHTCVIPYKYREKKKKVAQIDEMLWYNGGVSDGAAVPIQRPRPRTQQVGPHINHIA